MSQQLDPDVLARNLPDDIQDTVKKVSANVDLVVSGVIAKFQAAAQAELAKFEAGEFSAELQKKIDETQKAYAATADALDQDVRDLKAKADAALLASTQAGATVAALQKEVAALKQAADGLGTKMKQMRTNVEALGSKTASAVATTAYRAFTGGVL